MTCTINASPTNNLQVSADGSGIIQIQSNGVNTNAQAWVQFTCPTGTVTVNRSYNVSSVTRLSQGAYTITFSNALPSSSYSAVASSSNLQNNTNGGFAQVFSNPNVGDVAPTTTSFVVGCRGLSGAAYDADYLCAVVFG